MSFGPKFFQTTGVELNGEIRLILSKFKLEFCQQKIIFESKITHTTTTNFDHTVNLSFSTTDRDRPVSVTKFCSQISHPNRTLFTVSLILNQSTRLKLNINIFKTSSKII